MYSRLITIALILLLFLYLIDTSEAKKSKNKKEKPKKPKLDKKEAKNYLWKFGYLEDEEFAKDTDGEMTKKAIKRLQKRAGLEETGEADDATLEVMASPRCGYPDEEKGTHGKKFKNKKGKKNGHDKRYVTTGSTMAAWIRGQPLSYRILNGSSNGGLTLSQVESIFARAFNFWTTVTDLKFVKVTGADYNFNIYFAGTHTDVYGNEVVWGSIDLAHAYTPPGGPYEGQCHFNDLKAFNDRNPRASPKRFDLMEIAIHEIGHNLGLRHTGDTEAIMAPVYSYHEGYARLHFDDVVGIQSLYGKPSSAKPLLCHLGGMIDAIFEKGNFMYVFQGHEYYIFNKNGQIEPGFPRNFTVDYVIGRLGVSAAALIPAGVLGSNKEQTYLFVKDVLYVYEDTRVVRILTKTEISDLLVGINFNDMYRIESSAFVDGKLLIVYDEFDDGTFNEQYTCVPQSSGKFNCVRGQPIGDPYPVWCVGAVNIGNNEMIFVKDTGNYFTRDKTTKKTIPPLKSVVDFFNCNAL